MLIAPVKNSAHGVMENSRAKQVIRAAWHWTSLLWILVAAYLFFAACGEIACKPLLLIIGFVYLVAGLLDAILTRGKHIGWAPITLIRVPVLLAS